MATKSSGSSELSAITEAAKLQMEGGRTRTRPLPAPTQLMNMTTGFQETREELSRLRKEAGRALKVRLELCDEGPFHTSPLDPVRVASLKANLEHNGQSTPALVRAKEGGRFDILAGRHRKAAFLELGKSEWDVTVKEVDDDAAERLTFYDNLLAPTLSDYAKYLGFARRKASKALTLEQLAKESGVSKSAVGRLMSFGLLPERAQHAIAAAAEKFGGTLAEELAGLSEKHAERVVEAVEMVASGSLAENRARAWVLAPVAAPKAESNETIVKAGKAGYARMQRRAGQLTVRFVDPEEAKALEKAVLSLLQTRAKEVKSK